MADVSSGIEAGASNLDGIIRLAMLNQETGMLAEAERLYSDALIVAEREYGMDSRRVASVLQLVANAVLARDAFQEAEALLLRAMAIEESQLGVDHPDLVVLLNDLGRLYLKQGAYARAEPVLQRLLALKRVKGDEHPEVATVLASLASVRRGVGDHEEAEQLCRRVLQIREKTLAPNHFAVAAALEHLAEACAARGKASEAMRHYQRALSIRQQTLGVTHPSLRPSRERIADLLLQSSEGAMDGAPAERATSAPWAVSFPGSRTPAPNGRNASPPAASMLASAPLPTAPSAYTPLVQSSPERELRRDEELSAPLAVDPVMSAEAARHSLLSIDPALLASPGSMHHDLQQRIQLATELPEVGLLERVGSVFRSSRVQAVVIGVAALALLMSAVAAYRRTAVDDEHDLASAAQLVRSVNAGTLNSRSQDSLVSTASDGALAQGRFATGSAAPANRARPSASDAGARATRASDEPSLELSSVLHPAAPNVATVNTDSVVRSASLANQASGGAISKQTLSKAIEAATTPSSSREAPTETRAQLIGAQPQPVYPDYLRRAGVKGDVVVQFVVDDQGKPDLSSFTVVQSPHELLTNEVRRVVGRMRFNPARTGGPSPKPRSERVQIDFTFDDAAK